MRHWQDTGARRVWRWILLIYALAASALCIYGSFGNVRELLFVALFLASTVLIIIPQRLQSGWLAAVIALLCCATLPGAYSETIFNDMAAGRRAIQYEILGVPVHRSVEERDLTGYYRAYVSKDLPEPRWWRDSTDIILFIPVHLDRFGPSLSIADREFKRVFERYRPLEEVKTHVIRTFFELNTRSESPHTQAISYAKAVAGLFDAKSGEITLSDLSNPEALIADWQEKLEANK